MALSDHYKKDDLLVASRELIKLHQVSEKAFLDAKDGDFVLIEEYTQQFEDSLKLLMNLNKKNRNTPAEDNDK